MDTIQLASSDGKVFTVDVKVAKQSMTIKTMLEYATEEKDEAIPLPNVSGDILERIIKWATHHKNDAPYNEEDEGARRTDDIPEWDQGFLNVDQTILFELILAANYLDIKPLLDFTCKTVANMIKGKTPEQIRKTFKVGEQEGDKAAAKPNGAGENKMEA